MTDVVATTRAAAPEAGLSLQPTRVLIVCTGNSARSILAEAVLRAVGGADFEVFSAGTEPKGVNPLTLRVLEEAGLPTEGLRSKSTTGFLGRSFDYVITVCDQARQSCPVFPGDGERLHWGYEDPAAAEGDDEARLRVFRRVLTQLSERMRTFVILVGRSRRERALASDPDAAAPPAHAELLRQVPLFSAMTARALAEVTRIGSVATIPAGATLTREGEPGDTFLVVLRGRATVMRGGVSVGSVAEGDFLGEIAVLDGGVRTATVTADEPIEAFVVTRADLHELIDRSSTVRLAVIDALTTHLRRDARDLS